MSMRLSVVLSHTRSAIRWPAALVLLLLVAVAPRPAFAEAADKPDAVTPVEEFSRQLDELKKTFKDLNQRIDESAKLIDGETDPGAARKEIAELRALVSSLLGAPCQGARRRAGALRRGAAAVADQRRLRRRVDGDPAGHRGVARRTRPRQADPRRLRHAQQFHQHDHAAEAGDLTMRPLFAAAAGVGVGVLALALTTGARIPATSRSRSRPDSCCRRWCSAPEATRLTLPAAPARLPASRLRGGRARSCAAPRAPRRADRGSRCRSARSPSCGSS